MTDAKWHATISSTKCCEDRLAALAQTAPTRAFPHSEPSGAL